MRQLAERLSGRYMVIQSPKAISATLEGRAWRGGGGDAIRASRSAEIRARGDTWLQVEQCFFALTDTRWGYTSWVVIGCAGGAALGSKCKYLVAFVTR